MSVRYLPRSLRYHEAGFTLLELIIATVILSALAMIAIPTLTAVRQKAYLAAATAETRHVVMAIEQFSVINGRLPYALSDLRSVGYSEGPNVKVCWFEYWPATPRTDAHIWVQTRHLRGPPIVVSVKHPIESIRQIEGGADPSCRW